MAFKGSAKRRFVLIGAAGYIAPRHLKAIRDVGGELVAAMDPHDSVGVLDSYFPECRFFTEFERFDRFCEKEIRQGRAIDYVSICSPNYLHDAHCRFAMRIGADAICEKPLVLRERNLDALEELEESSGCRIYSILQLRLSERIPEIRKAIEAGWRKVVVDYRTPRGPWYRYSWKGNVEKSGGLATNIGIHLFDLIFFLFGQPTAHMETDFEGDIVGDLLYSDDRLIHYFLSISNEFPARRELIIHREDVQLVDDQFDLSSGFADLHSKSYREILEGRGFGIEDVRPSIRFCESIRGKV
jgi:UDP-N-acetyl-2-amino-2-deoxyglucuronate dehydrogenase